MENSKNIKYIVIGLFALLAIRRVTILIDSFSALNLVGIIAFALVIAALLQSMPILSTVGFSLLAIVSLIGVAPLFSSLKWIIYAPLGWVLIITVFRGIGVYVLLALASINSKSAKTFCTIAAGVEIVGLIAHIIYNCYYYSALTISSILFSLVLAAAAFLLGVVYNNDMPQQPIIATNIAHKPSPQKATDDNKIEKLTQLKTLLDNEIITQEEFEEKKKHIL